tara:strand:- start:174 stop:287 length:114 start_codon:yes stop_codon:yes gene_type:complete
MPNYSLNHRHRLTLGQHRLTGEVIALNTQEIDHKKLK